MVFFEELPRNISGRPRLAWKTGLTLQDTGIRDENGLEPMDGLFSSPEKPDARSQNRANGIQDDMDQTLTSEEDMDMVESPMPDPQEILQKRANIRLPPHSKSPIKTFLHSPARRNPSFGPSSSPIRGSTIAPKSVLISSAARRRLNFSNNADDSNDPSPTPKRRAGFALASTSTAKRMHDPQLAPLRETLSPEIGGHQDEEYSAMMDGSDVDNNEDDYQIVHIGDDEPEPEEESSEEPPEPEPEPIKKGKRNATEPAASEPPVKKAKRGRPRKSDPEIVGDEPPKRKVGRPSIRASETSRDKIAQSKKHADNTKKIEQSANASTSKPRGRKPKLATTTETESPAVKRGPPLPRNNRGLMILRRETPAEGTGFQQTRSGRNSIKPLAFWKNERVEYSEDEADDNWSKNKFLLPKIREVVRADEVEQPTAKRSKFKSKGKSSRMQLEEEDDEPAEPWETEPGRIVGDIRVWDPEDPVGEQAEEAEEEIALSSAAIVTRDVKNGTFKFAKTLTLPFFGSGMVDLPPRTSKKPKNSRKMQMVFFVYYGKVQVTVNDSVFRIGKGGMWQIPRGNFYSIENDYDAPARIFFAQGCEVMEQDPDITQ